MALPDLLRALREQAAEKCEQEIGAAARAAEGIRAESRTALERRRAEFLGGARRHEEQGAHRAVSHARAEAAAAELAARDRLLTRVKGALEERIDGAATDEAFVTSLSVDIARGLARLPEGRVVLRTRPELVEAVTVAVGDRRGVDVRATAEVGVGFLAAVEDAGVEVDGTLRARLEHAWPRLAVEVLREAAK